MDWTEIQDMEQFARGTIRLANKEAKADPITDEADTLRNCLEWNSVIDRTRVGKAA